MEAVVLIGGYGTGEKTYQGEIEKLKEFGWNVLFFPPSSSGNRFSQRGFEIIQQLEYTNRIPSALVGHSEGSLVAAFIAGQRPEWVRKLVLISPPGLCGRDTGIRLMTRSVVQLAKETWISFSTKKKNPKRAKAMWRATKVFLQSILKNPIQKIFFEIPMVARSGLLPYLESVRFRAYGRCEVILLTSHEDTVFPIEDMHGKREYRDTMEEKNPEGYFWGGISRWASFSHGKASHNAIFLEKPGVLIQILGGAK